MKPYVVRRGDHLRRLAYEHAFDADEVWDHDKNASLRKVRTSMDLLCSGDILYVPEAERIWIPVTVGAVNTFVVTIPRTTVEATLHFVDKPISGATCTVRELPDLGTLTTSEAGFLTFQVPISFRAVTVLFESIGLAVVLNVGHLDPVETPSGIHQRLRNMGYPVGQTLGNQCGAARGRLHVSAWTGPHSRRNRGRRHSNETRWTARQLRRVGRPCAVRGRVAGICFVKLLVWRFESVAGRRVPSVQNDEQLAHGGDNGDAVDLTGRKQAVIERPDRCIMECRRR